MPYNSPMKKKGSSCVQMKDHKGKPSGLMMEGSVAYQESEAQEVVNLETKNPVADKASAMEMSPYKMGHESPAKMGHKDSPMHDNHDKDERSGDGVTVTGDLSKVGAYGRELDDIFSGIQSTLDAGGYSSSRAQSEAGLGYGTNASQELNRLQQKREKEGVISTLKYIKRRQRN